MNKPKVVIDRSKWRVGGEKNNHNGDTCLLNQNGYMCCLGFVCNQAYELSEEELLCYAEPEDVLREETPLTYIDKVAGKTYYPSSQVSENAMSVNDNSEISNEDREKEVLKILSPYYNIEFVGEYS